MKLTALHLCDRHESSSCLRLFFAGFGQDAHVFESVLQSAAQNLIANGDPWLAEDLEHSPDIVMLSAYTAEDKDFLDQLAKEQPQVPPPPVKTSRQVEVNASALSFSALDGIEISFHEEVEEEVDHLVADKQGHLRMLRDLILRYDSVEIVAWSFGVHAALSIWKALAIPQEKLSYAVALAGTIPAVDRHYGISPRAYDLTLRMLNPDTWRQFQKNMCLPVKGRAEEVAEGDAVYNLLCSQVGERRLPDLVEELGALPHFAVDENAWDMALLSLDLLHKEKLEEEDKQKLEACATPALVFDQVFISEADGIFPAKAQQQYWQQYKKVVKLLCPERKCEVLGFPMPHLYPTALLNALTTAPHHHV